MRVLIAPASFKGSISAVNVAKIIRKALSPASAAAPWASLAPKERGSHVCEGVEECEMFPATADIAPPKKQKGPRLSSCGAPPITFQIIPISDGGDGFIDSLADSSTRIVSCQALDPLGRPIVAQFSISGKKAIIEMANASGLKLLNESERKPMITNTFGTGQLIKKALDENIRKIVLGAGGSATVDCGTGALCALGVRFLDAREEEVYPCAETLMHIKDFDFSYLDTRLKRTRLYVACDVNIKLYGKNGASYQFAGQKGASVDEIRKIDKNLKYFSSLVRKKLGADINKVMCGAAGGLAGGLAGFLGAKLVAGAKFVFDEKKLVDALRKSEVVITGEGSFDETSEKGKATHELFKIAARMNKKVFIICGTCSSKPEKAHVFTLDSIARSKKDSIRNARKYIFKLAEKIKQLI